MITNGQRARLTRLETKIRPPRGCDACIGLAGTVRLVKIDEDDGELWASRPEFCPSCGADLAPDSPFTKEIRIVGVDLGKV